MEITLEKIELVKDRTGATYVEARDALEKADGNVVDAIIAIEDSINEETHSKSLGRSGAAYVEKVKEIVQRGNSSRILVKKEDRVLLDLPVNAGVFGVVIAPWGMLAAAVASLGFKCRVQIVKTDGSVMDVSQKTEDLVDDAKTRGEKFRDDLKEKGPEFYETMKGKGGEALTKAKEAAKSQSPDWAKDAAGKMKDAAGKAQDAVKDAAGKAQDAAKGAAGKAQDAVKDAAGKAQDAVKGAAGKAQDAAKGAAGRVKEAAGKIRGQETEDNPEKPETAWYEVDEEKADAVSGKAVDQAVQEGQSGAVFKDGPDFAGMTPSDVDSGKLKDAAKQVSEQAAEDEK